MPTILNNLEVADRLTVVLSGSDLVVKGGAGPKAGRLVGEARVEQREGETVIHAEDSLVLMVPSHVALTLRGQADNVALSDLAEVLLANSCNGDLALAKIRTLNVEGALHGDVALRHIGENLKLGEISGDLAISHAAGVELATVHGDASLSHVANVQLHQMHGDVTLRHVGEVQIDQAHSDLTLSRAASLQAHFIAGTAHLDAVEGPIVLQQVDGNLIVHQPGSSLVASSVGGDAHLIGNLKANSEHVIKADGDVRLDVTGNVHVTVRSVDGELHLGEGLEQEQGEDGVIHVYMGQREGAAQVTVEAAGDVSVGLLERERRHRKHWSEHVHFEPGGNFHFEGRVHMDPEMREAMEQAREEVKRAQHEVKEELKRAKQHIREEMRNAFREREGRGGPGPVIGEVIRGTIGEVIRGNIGELLAALRPTPPAPPGPPPAPERPVAPPPSSEELKLILSMVQEGKISPEEAEQLIRAME